MKWENWHQNGERKCLLNFHYCPSYIESGKFRGYVWIALTSSLCRNIFENVSDLIMRHLTVENCTFIFGLKAKLKSNSLIIFAVSIPRLSEPCIQQLNQCLVQLQSKTHCMCFCSFKSGHIFYVFYFDIRLNPNSVSTQICFGGISFLVDKILTVIDASYF